MKIVIIILAIIILIAFLILIFIINYNKLKWINLKVNKGEINISGTLDKKYEILLKYFSILKEKISTKDADFNNVDFIDNLDISSFNSKLNELNNNINNYLDNNEKLLKEEKINLINKELNNINICLNGLKKYYNSNLVIYNKLCKSFPSNVIAKILKYQEKEFIEDSNMEEDLKILDEEEE